MTGAERRQLREALEIIMSDDPAADHIKAIGILSRLARVDYPAGPNSPRTQGRQLPEACRRTKPNISGKGRHQMKKKPKRYTVRAGYPRPAKFTPEQEKQLAHAETLDVRARILEFGAGAILRDEHRYTAADLAPIEEAIREARAVRETASKIRANIHDAGKKGRRRKK